MIQMLVKNTDLLINLVQNIPTQINNKCIDLIRIAMFTFLLKYTKEHLFS